MGFDCLCIHSKVGGIKQIRCDKKHLLYNAFCPMCLCCRFVQLLSILSYLQLTDLITRVSPCGVCEAGRS